MPPSARAVATAILLLVPGCVPVARHDPAPGPVRVVTVGFGDTLWGLATEFGHPGGYTALARDNGIRNPHVVWAGDTLRVRTDDPSLPVLAQTSPAPPLAACPTQAANRWATTLSGCAEAACVDTGRGSQVCLCKGADPTRDALYLSRPGHAPERFPVESRAAWWFDPEVAPEPERSAGSLVGLRAELDGDPGLETLVSWRTQLNDVGMAAGTALVVDDDGSPGPRFAADQVGIGSAVRQGDGCALLVTEWTYTDEPENESDGWYLTGRRYGLKDGALTLDAPTLVMRRLLYTFRPTFGLAGSVRVPAPAVDLAAAGAFVRSTEPLVEARLLGREAATVRSARAVDGRLALDLGAGELAVGEQAPIRRLGDLTSGLLYPEGYVPAGDRSLRGRQGELRTYASTWGSEFAVFWMR